jgi:hypothetical protein
MFLLIFPSTKRLLLEEINPAQPAQLQLAQRALAPLISPPRLLFLLFLLPTTTTTLPVHVAKPQPRRPIANAQLLAGGDVAQRRVDDALGVEVAGPRDVLAEGVGRVVEEGAEAEGERLGDGAAGGGGPVAGTRRGAGLEKGVGSGEIAVRTDRRKWIVGVTVIRRLT